MLSPNLTTRYGPLPSLELGDIEQSDNFFDSLLVE